MISNATRLALLTLGLTLLLCRGHLAGAGTHRGALPAAFQAAAAPGQSGGPRFELEEATIADLQQRMQAGLETSRSLVEKYLARIDAIDRHGPAPCVARPAPSISALLEKGAPAP